MAIWYAIENWLSLVHESYTNGFTLVAAALLILNVVLISFYVKRRAKKQMMSGTVTGSTVTNGKLF